MKTKIILALDVNNSKEAYSLIDELVPYVGCFKVGSILYAECGNTIVEQIKKKDKMVFLDLKFFDIPNTVRGVSYVATKIGVDMFTIHLLGGKEMIKASLDGVNEAMKNSSFRKPLVLGVTVLTSMDEEILKNELKVNYPLEEFILHLANMGYEMGLKGFVCSPYEVRLLKKNISADIITVTPGVRISSDEWNDQKRVMTPKMASQEGADYIVVGRSVLKQPDRIKILEQIRNDLN